MILLHQEEVDLLKTAILSLLRLLPPPTRHQHFPSASHPYIWRDGAGLILCLKCLSTLSKLTSCIVSRRAGAFPGLLFPSGWRMECVQVSGWAAGVASL